MSGFLPVEALSSLSPQAQALVGASSAQPLQAPALPAPGEGAASAAGSFGSLVTDGLARLNGQLIGGQVDLQRLALGDAGNLHQIMIDLEETRVNFQLMMQVRSRLLEAYQDIMKMPI